MKHQTLTGIRKCGKTMRPAHVLADMDQLIPWPELTPGGARDLPEAGDNGGRARNPGERTRRLCVLQTGFNLADRAIEGVLRHSVAMHGFFGIALGVEGTLGQTNVCKFRHHVERNKSRVSAKVDNVFGMINNISSFKQIRYLGLVGNQHRLKVTAALASLYLVRR